LKGGKTFYYRIPRAPSVFASFFNLQTQALKMQVFASCCAERQRSAHKDALRVSKGHSALWRPSSATSWGVPRSGIIRTAQREAVCASVEEGAENASPSQLYPHFPFLSIPFPKIPLFHPLFTKKSSTKTP